MYSGVMVSQCRMAAGPYNWDIAAGVEGWRVFELSHAVNIKANRDYIVSVSNSAEDLLNLFTRPGFSEPIVNGDLVTYVGSGVYNPVLGEMPYHVL